MLEEIYLRPGLFFSPLSHFFKTADVYYRLSRRDPNSNGIFSETLSELFWRLAAGGVLLAMVAEFQLLRSIRFTYLL